MRPHRVAVVLAGLLGGSVSVSVAAGPLMLPLTLANRQAYVATVSVNGQPTLLQLGTLTSDVWLACGRFGSRVCTPGKCDAFVTVETKNLCVTPLADSTLTIGSSGDALAFPDVTLKVAQYHVMDENATAPRIHTTADGQVYSTPDYSFEQPALVRKDIQGVLGLGLNSDVALNFGSKTNPFAKKTVLDKVKAFALYLVRENDGIGSYVQLGSEDDAGIGFDSVALLGRGLTTPYQLPLRRTGSKESDFESWDLSIVGVQFGGDTALYPRKYATTETPGADATAVLSLNHPLLQMPYEVSGVFEKAYLRACSYRKTEPAGYYYSCGLSILETLPRISLYINDKVFFLDPVDYTHVSSSNDSARIVEIWNSGYDRKWILGMPFLRKFPTIFRASAQTVEVYCTAGSSCRTQTGAFDRVNAESRGDGDATGGSSSTTAMTLSPPSAPPSYSGSSGRAPQLLPWITWIMLIVGTTLVLTLVTGLVKTWMHKLEARRRGMDGPPTGEACTVASERDLEEAKRDLQQMIAEEETEARASSTRRQNGSFVALESPRDSTTSDAAPVR